MVVNFYPGIPIYNRKSIDYSINPQKRVGFDDYRNSICQMSDSDEDFQTFPPKKRLNKGFENPLAQTRIYNDAT